MRAFAFALAVSLVVPVATLCGQQPPPIEPSERVRVTAPWVTSYSTSGRMEATVVEQRGDTIQLKAEGFDALEATISSVTRLEVSGGQHRRWGRGALIGLVIGAGIGAMSGPAIGAAVSAGPCFDQCTSTARDVAAGALLLAVPGALIGAGIGALIKTDRWEEVPLDRLSVSFAPRRAGYALGLSVSF